MKKLGHYQIPEPVKPAPGVICGGKTKTQFVNPQTGVLEYVHNYHEEGNLGCKEVWRYLQERVAKLSLDELEDATSLGDEAAWCAILENEHDPGFFLDEKGLYSGYRSYIRSREWRIKAEFAKR